MRATVLILSLLLGANPCWSASMFTGDRPYECIRDAKMSGRTDYLARKDLADCLLKTYKAPDDLALILKDSGFPIYTSDINQLKEMPRDKAEAALREMIMSAK